MKILLTIVLFVAFLIPNQVNAWWIFGPSNYDDCILKYQKEAKCEGATYLVNYSCNCKFNPENCREPATNPAVWDCILKNIGSAQNDAAAGAISRACRSKYNK
jgi:hypothetical protein